MRNLSQMLILGEKSQLCDLISVISQQKDQSNQNAYIITEQGQLIGSITLKDIAEYIYPALLFSDESLFLSLGSGLQYLPLSDFWDDEPYVLTENTNRKDALKQILLSPLNTLPIVNHRGILQGEITLSDILSKNYTPYQQEPYHAVS